MTPHHRIAQKLSNMALDAQRLSLEVSRDLRDDPSATAKASDLFAASEMMELMAADVLAAFPSDYSAEVTRLITGRPAQVVLPIKNTS